MLKQSHHSHSGQFCQHATDDLEKIILSAIEYGFDTYGLSEHMPRYQIEDLYPEEASAGTSPESLQDTFEAYTREARRLQSKYADRIKILVGFEGEYIRQDDLQHIAKIKSSFDYWIGSVHFVKEIPIDFNEDLWNKAVAKCGDLDNMYELYFDDLWRVVQLHPPIIGHIDRVRVFDKNHTLALSNFPKAWARMKQVVDYVVDYDGLFELNSSAYRKGWDEPYPKKEIVEYIKHRGGKFCLSDDSHGISQIGLNYSRMLDFIKQQKISELWILIKTKNGVEKRSYTVEAI